MLCFWVWDLMFGVWDLSSEFGILIFGDREFGFGFFGFGIWSLVFGFGILEFVNSVFGFCLDIWRLVFGILNFKVWDFEFFLGI